MKMAATLLVALTGTLASGCSGESREAKPECREERSLADVDVGSRPIRAIRPPAHGLWISQAELRRLPTSGAAWEELKATADGELGVPAIADMDSGHDVRTMGVALVYARTGEEQYRRKAAEAIASAIGTEEGGRGLELGRNLLSYVIAADLIDYERYDPAGEADFREWLGAVRHEPLSPDAGTLVRTADGSASNWGGMAGASRVAIAAYLGDKEDLARAAQVMKGWLGDRSAYPGIPAACYGPEDVGKGFRLGGSEEDLSWQADPSRPVGVNPKGAAKEGHSIDGALPDDMRRGGPFEWPPVYTQYPREALSGYVAYAEILYRQGYDVYEWEDKGLLRATQFLWELEQEFPEEEWWEPDTPVYWIINYRYGASFPVGKSWLGRNVGFADWTHASG
jgi:Alginate lyase